jgi:hypothetical protein
MWIQVTTNKRYKFGVVLPKGLYELDTLNQTVQHPNLNVSCGVSKRDYKEIKMEWETIECSK